MIEKKTIIDQIEITKNGFIQIRFAILLVEDGVEISSHYHRAAIEPGGDVDAALEAVNADISTRQTLRAPSVDGEKVGLLKSIVSLVHTPETVKLYRETVSAAPV